ncbi:glycosyltransferase [Kitasatospora phosalacinea]|uniref:GDP-mannose-dependent alpha-(1-6)-phosphatidylinositol dimannoside mannosyltransferase n=1 Tax=Kitasatospora phosalacinea TaxID=2065 RepID=A0A9W6PP27_9ACTN|nr:glycosyltransferase [Kitasatospora phosalacinea]GLW58252.1 GDP-mannose-dependent alpha-(1-6)-phosphatidylinositol dimannoside mannosyltransferase [Kitasatospora phosalacinea]
MNRETARTDGGLCIVRLANFVTPVSGGLRTTLRHLGAGYLAAGHRPVLVVPGPVRGDEWTEQGRVITLPGPRVPGSGGYRVLRDKRRLAALLDELAPDRLEVSDRTTLRWTGAWAKAHGVRSMMVSHESATGVLGAWGVPTESARRLADRLNSRTAHGYDTVLCTTAWAAEEFERIGARNIERAPLGVDLETMRPECHDPSLRAELADAQQVLLVMCSRLSGEKRPERALEALAELRRRHRVPAVLAVAGAGPLRGRLERRAAELRLPVRFLGHLAGRSELAALLATADAVIAPGPVETFGLAALETLACGTPVAVSRSSALPQVVGGAGAAAADSGAGFALAVRELLDRPETERRAAARARAEEFGWDAATAAFLAAHRAPAPTPPPAPRPAPTPAVD